MDGFSRDQENETTAQRAEALDIRAPFGVKEKSGEEKLFV
jgi:hypothetical protein